MNTKHILLTSALVVSALAFTSCEDFFDTSSKKDVDFSEKAPVKKLNLLSGKTYAGNTAKEFVATKPFQFLGIK